MRKNGFTLIELLAVIVILAIIALIATPIILGIINDAREESNERSVELYAAAVRNAVAAYQLTGTTAPKSFSDLDIQYDGKVECTTEELYEDGSFYLEGCTVNGGEKTYNYGKKKENVQPACTLDDKDGDGKASLSDVVTCVGESFYVMNNENNEITMLTMYNLNVGNNKYPNEETYGIQDEHVFAYKEGNDIYGDVDFSSTNHWASTVNDYPAFVYNDKSDIIYSYVESYETYLNESGVTSATATLMNLQQIQMVGCNINDYYCGDPEWAWSTSYWTGVAYSSDALWVIDNSANLNFMSYDHDGNSEYENYDAIGVRPVITISTSEIQ